MANSWKNWSGGVASAPKHIALPRSASELQTLMRTTTGNLRPVGAGHSFSPLCHTDDTLVDLRHLAGVISHESGLVTLHAGTPLRVATHALAALGLALPNQGDIDHQTVAGVTATGSHGTGLALGSVATSVRAVTICTPSGEFVTWRHGVDKEFAAAAVSLGLLGIASEITLACEPAYHLQASTALATTSAALANFMAQAEANRHFELFVFPQADRAIEKTVNRTDKPGGLTKHDNGLLDDVMLWAVCALGHLWPGASARLQRLLLRTVDGDTRHGAAHLIFPSERRLRFEETEFAVPLARGLECTEEILHCLRTQFPEIAFPIEVRTVAADDLWLSPFYGEPRITISIHERPHGRVAELFAAVAAIFDKYDGRPHLGKQHALTAPQLRARLPRFDDFARLRRDVDPQGRMLSPRLTSWFGDL